MDPMRAYGLPFLAELMILAAHAKAQFRALPPEEQQTIIERRNAEREAQRVQWCLSQGKCPDCGGKLLRGKRDKLNGYKRERVCTKCDKTFY